MFKGLRASEFLCLGVQGLKGSWSTGLSALLAHLSHESSALVLKYWRRSPVTYGLRQSGRTLLSLALHDQRVDHSAVAKTCSARSVSTSLPAYMVTDWQEPVISRSNP